jgi:hypothetical protein
MKSEIENNHYTPLVNMIGGFFISALTLFLPIFAISHVGDDSTHDSQGTRNSSSNLAKPGLGK